MKGLKLLWLLLPLFISCVRNGNDTGTSDLERIKGSDTLRVVTLSRSTSYFDIQGVEMGYEFELAQKLAESLGVNLRVYTGNDISEMIEMLNDGKVDIVAYPVPITIEDKERLEYISHEFINKQVVVQRKEKNQILNVQSTTDFLGKEVYVVENSKYHRRLEAIDKEIGGGLIIQTVSNEENEESLIEKVANGEIDYTIVDDPIAKVNQTYYNNLDVSVWASLDQRSAWAVRKSSEELRDTINSWFESMKCNYAIQYLEKKYFEKKKKNQSKYPKYLSRTKISDFDPLFKKYAGELDWDWKLLASVAYQESRFNPDARSWAGAQGLMQLMPSTAYKYGVDSISIGFPEPNIKAAVKYIGRVANIFKYIENKEERTKFVLASYNAGVGHIRDAMALAEKHGKSPDLWSDVSVFVLMKSKPEFFNDPVVQHGYLRGEEVTSFVNDIMIRFHEYNEVIID